MFQQETDETLMGAQRGPVNDQGCFKLIIGSGILKFKAPALRKVNLVGCKVNSRPITL
jgi:hypothetical protein